MSEPIPDFRSAVAWLGEHLDTEQPPTRLHDRAIGDDGAPRLSGRFLSWLDARPYDARRTIQERDCHHPHIAKTDLPRDCTLCLGTGTYEAQVRLYVRPMRAALERVRTDPGRIWPAKQPNPYVILRILFLYEFDGPAAALHMGMGWDRYEALAVMATRMLRGRYQLAPSSGPGWVSKSESQRAAEDAA